jgi:integrase
MARRRTPGLYRRKRADGSVEWHIDKFVKRFGRLCESTGTNDEEEAERYLARRLAQIREGIVYGVRPRRKWRDAATRYLTESADKKSVERAARALKDLDRHIGDLWLDQVHNDSLQRYRVARKAWAVGTLNRTLAVVRRILKLSAELWRDEQSGLTWLAVAPMIKLESKYKKRQPYPLGWDEQALLFPELAGHLQRMALFAVNTGARQEEICGLKWRWEQRVPELDTPSIQRTVFVLPGSVTKNGEPRVLVLNDVAQAVIEEVRRHHRTYVFTYQDRHGQRNRVGRMNNKGWRAARRRATAQYNETLERESPTGFKSVRVHDLRHTFGRRLRAAGVGLEDRQDLLGHKSSRMTTHYSAAELGNLLSAANLATKSRESPARTVLHVVGG